MSTITDGPMLAWVWYPCPCCDIEFAYSERRDQHILEDHLKPAGPWNISVWCWCGTLLPAKVQASDAQQHWDQHGGVVEHYVACLLGID